MSRSSIVRRLEVAVFVLILGFVLPLNPRDGVSLAEQEKTVVRRAGFLEAHVRSAAVKDDALVNYDWLEGSAETRKRLDDVQGKPAPALAVKDWHNGEAVKLADLKGKVVLLDFWATWSTSCIDSIRRTNELQEKYKDKGLVIIAVCHSVGAEKMPQVLKEHGIQYRVAADTDGKTSEAYKVDSYPDYYLIDRTGNLRIADCRNASVEEAVRALLAEPEAQASAK